MERRVYRGRGWPEDRAGAAAAAVIREAKRDSEGSRRAAVLERTPLVVVVVVVIVVNGPSRGSAKPESTDRVTSHGEQHNRGERIRVICSLAESLEASQTTHHSLPPQRMQHAPAMEERHYSPTT